MNVYLEQAGQVSVAFVIGGILGIEREFRSKAAGFRTMILICVGSCLFTILSKEAANLGASDRIASNIVTGIGFIGAGVIFKEGISVKGLTTAALIWITAAMGMAVGYHDYPVAIVVTTIVVITLFILEPVHQFIQKFHKVKDYKIVTDGIGNNLRADLEKFFITNELSFRCMKIVKENNDAVFLYRISSPDRNYDLVNHFLLEHTEVKSFDV